MCRDWFTPWFPIARRLQAAAASAFTVVFSTYAAAAVPTVTWTSAPESSTNLPSESPSRLCRSAIASAEAGSRIPDLFLSAIGRVESGRALPATGQVSPWPWTVDAEGQGRFYETKSAAIEAVQALQARGVRSIDVGCLQVNLLQHPEAFASLDQAFEPQTNAAFAARLLASLFVQTGSWPLAAAAYHSQTPSLGAPYQQRVLAAWAMPDRPAAGRVGPQALSFSAVQGTLPAPAAVGSNLVGGQAITGFGHVLRGYPGAAGGQESTQTHGRGLDAYRRFPVVLAMHLRKPAG